MRTCHRLTETLLEGRHVTKPPSDQRSYRLGRNEGDRFVSAVPTELHYRCHTLLSVVEHDDDELLLVGCHCIISPLFVRGREEVLCFCRAASVVVYETTGAGTAGRSSIVRVRIRVSNWIGFG